MSEKQDAKRIWNNILKSAIALPGIAIDRETFLRKELRKFCDETTLEKVVKENPTKYINKSEAAKIAKGCINYHLTLVTGVSALAGLPGGWAMLATIPADLTQFYGHVLALAQKLMYIYGAPNIKNERDDIDDDTLAYLTVFVGVMMGVELAENAMRHLLNEFSKVVAKRLPKVALTKYSIFNLAKSIATLMGEKMTKETFSKGAGKMVPIIGAPISGATTYWTFKPMACKLKNKLEKEVYG